MMLSIDPANSGAHSLHAELAALRKTHTEIEVTTIDTVLQDLSITASDLGLVWIDVEGFEPEVLEGAASVTSANVPLYVEINAFNSEAVRRTVLGRLEAAGYKKAHAVGRSELPNREFSLKNIPSEYLSGDFLFL
jgi:Methyltransferase FkbM domain